MSRPQAVLLFRGVVGQAGHEGRVAGGSFGGGISGAA